MRRCQPSWLHTLLDYSAYLETSDLYVLWCGLVAIAIALGRKVWRDMGYRRLFPNLFLVLLGESGLGKSTALSLVNPIIREAVEELTWIEDHVTPEVLIKKLSSGAVHRTICGQSEIITPAYAHASEITTLISQVKYQRHITEFLTRLYDCETASAETLSHGLRQVQNPFLHLIGCTVPSNLQNAIRIESMTAGFAGRILFLFVDRHEKAIPFPEEQTIDHSLREALVLYVY